MSVTDLDRHATVASDAKAMRTVAWARVILVAVLAGVGSFLDHHDGLFLLIGLVWVPWSAAVLLAADDEVRLLARVGGPLGDVAALFAVQLLAPQAQHAVLFGYLVTVVFTTFTAGRVLAGALAAAALTLSLVASSQAPSDERLTSAEVLPFAGALVAVLLLARRSLSVHARVSARAEGLRTKADVILATVVGGVVVTDRTGRVIEANPAAERIVGAGGPLAGHTCAEALGLHSGAKTLDCSDGCPLLLLAGPDVSQGQELWRVNAAGEKQPILARAVTLSTSDGIEVVHSIQDITRLKQAEEAKTLFLATASHELKTPLTVINGFAETLTRYQDLDPETQQMALTAIRTRGKELARVVDRLLLSSRIEAGKVALVTQPVALLPLLRERVASLAQVTDRSISCDLPESLQEVRAEPDALITVMDHLLENALKYSPDGGSVEVTAVEDGDRTRITVTDHGIGMDAEQAAHCFDKFWQAESTDVRRFGGTGIGLYIVHSLVEAMDGRITVSSTPGKGTGFTVELSAASAVPGPRESGQGESTSIREFMRQIGVPSGGTR